MRPMQRASRPAHAGGLSHTMSRRHKCHLLQFESGVTYCGKRHNQVIRLVTITQGKADSEGKHFWPPMYDEICLKCIKKWTSHTGIRGTHLEEW